MASLLKEIRDLRTSIDQYTTSDQLPIAYQHHPDVLQLSPADPDVFQPSMTDPDVLHPDVFQLSPADPDVLHSSLAYPDVFQASAIDPDDADPDVFQSSMADPDVSYLSSAHSDVFQSSTTRPDVLQPSPMPSDHVPTASELSLTASRTSDCTICGRPTHRTNACPTRTFLLDQGITVTDDKGHLLLPNGRPFT